MRVRTGWCLLAGLLLAASTCMALAAGPRAARKQVEASMLVTGRVMIERDGSVGSWTVDEREKLPEVVAQLVDESVPQWRFEPVLVDGKPVRGSARMNLRVMANRLDDGSGDFGISISAGYFGRDALDADRREALGLKGEYVSSNSLVPPQYPLRALEMHAQGMVYVALRVNRQGRVDDVLVEQVNLRTLGSERQMAQVRDLLSGATIKAARDWTFNVPTVGEWADEDSWIVRVPVNYRFHDAKEPGYGEWNAYVPGPRTPVPWQDAGSDDGLSPDTLIAGEVYQAGAGLKLLTPIGG